MGRDSAPVRVPPPRQAAQLKGCCKVGSVTTGKVATVPSGNAVSAELPCRVGSVAAVGVAGAAVAVPAVRSATVICAPGTAARLVVFVVLAVAVPPTLNVAVPL